ncbi:NAD(P)/FAD-dependent oxidoreductase [Telmatocola sphagniphila]|uniref:NAD(P)/FAD-dependent oxidoreductase n=1 Tax=Telmatocola sphagniphila TaxID=1123043 RepID=A0A8E6B4T8_9BACT|nr:NAD(P)/FAD-dependent oxidoreductase [Telmatocola sphagniphila]QVL31131.1 NAD(P)/FAD-dependent oxidoreductase [Telmatocola sphagniphila]
MQKNTAIIGGGVLGLELARRLRAQGHPVTLFESASEVGGLAAAWNIGDITWDKHYHVILLSDLAVRNVLADLGLENELEWKTTKTGFYTDGRLYSMSNSLEFLKFPPLRLIDKFRLALTIMKASRIKDWRYLESISVEDWLRKWSGNRTFEKIWLPLLRAKLGEQYTIASAAFIWAIIARMYAARRSGLKQEMFGYVRGGYARILKRFAEKLTEAGVSLRLHQPIDSIQKSATGLSVKLPQGTEEIFDRVFVTAPAAQLSRLCPLLSESTRKKLGDITYQGIVCASVLLKNKLADYYVTNITETWVPFTAVIEMTALVDPKELGDHHLVYLPKYVAPDDPLFSESDESIKERFLSALEKIYPHFHRDQVLAFQISRVRNVFAVTTKNYSSQVSPFETEVPGLYLVNSSQIVNGTLNVNESLQLAERAVTVTK